MEIWIVSYENRGQHAYNCNLGVFSTRGRALDYIHETRPNYRLEYETYNELEYKDGQHETIWVHPATIDEAFN